jgi:GTP pyrophosphokinase
MNGIFQDFTIYKRYSTHDKVQIAKALDFAKKHHQRQKRESGEDFISHPIRVAKILLQLEVIPEITTAALLHDVLEDTNAHFEDLHQEFGFNIAKLVNTLSKSHKIKLLKHNSDAERKALHHHFLDTIKDPKAAIIKVADRLHNIRTLNFLAPERQKRIACATVKAYVPLAYEIGTKKIAQELEIKSQNYLSPQELTHAQKVAQKYTREIKAKDYHQNALEECRLSF